MATRVEWDTNWQAQLLDLGDRPLDRAADIVLTAMRQTIPVSEDGSNGHPAGWAKSHLRVLEAGRDGQGPYRDVGTDAVTADGQSYPAMLHYGTKPHIIESHGPYPLRDRRGRVFGRRVHHPGTRPTYWATRALTALEGRQL